MAAMSNINGLGTENLQLKHLFLVGENDDFLQMSIFPWANPVVFFTIRQAQAKFQAPPLGTCFGTNGLQTLEPETPLWVRAEEEKSGAAAKGAEEK